MSYRAPPIDDYWLTEGVLSRRVFAWLIDVLLIGLIVGALCLVLLLFGLLTLGLGLPLLGVLPFVPFCYHLLFVAGPSSATPGQQALGLVVRRERRPRAADAGAGLRLHAGVLRDAGGHRPAAADRAVHRAPAHAA